MMEPASSSSSSSSENDDSDSDSSNSNTTGSVSPIEPNPPTPAEFDDLPSDDSCLDSDDDDDDNDDGSSSEDDVSYNGKDTKTPRRRNYSESPAADGEEEEEQQLSIGHQLDLDRNRGIVRRPGSVQKKKEEALKTARKRLRELSRSKQTPSTSTTKTKHDDDDDDDDDDEEEEDDDDQEEDEEETTNRTNTTKKSKNRHRPTSASSLRSAYFTRGAPNLNSSGITPTLNANRYKPRDPRSNDPSSSTALSTTPHDAEVTDRRYAFLNDIRDEEIQTLQQRCKAWNKTGRAGRKKRRRMGMTDGSCDRDEDRERLETLLKERASERVERERRNARREVNRKMKADVAQGKRGVYYLKKRDRKRMEMEARYEEIRKKGGEDALNKVLAKKRKKERSRDAALMPRDVPF